MVLIIVAGILISGFLGLRGLIRGEIDLSYETTLTGKWAKTASWLCIAFSVFMVAILLWLFLGAPGS